MKPKTIIAGLISATIALVAILFLTGCVQTYRVIHSGTITIQSPDQDVNLWGPGTTITPGEIDDDFWQSIPAEPGLILNFSENEIRDTVEGDGIRMIYRGDWITIENTSPDTILVEVPDAAVPSELKVCKHAMKTTFLDGYNGPTCHCFECGAWWNGACPTKL